MLENFNYPKQYIINESEGTKIYKKIGEDEGARQVDEFQWKVVSTISEKKNAKKKYYLIQYEDEQLGWIELKNSIHIFRFEPKVFKFVDEDFKANEINDQLGIVKDFKTHFAGKLLEIKSEIEYNGERLYSVFVKDRFFGFHSVNHFEELLECNIEVPENKVSQKRFYKYSKVEEPIEDEVVVSNPKIVSVFKGNNVGRIKANSKEFYWINLDGLERYVAGIENNQIDKSLEQKYIDDLLYGVKKERQHSKELVKTVLKAKDYLKSKKAKEKDMKIKRLQNSFNNSLKKNESLYASYKRADLKIRKFESSFKNAKDKQERLNKKITDLKERLKSNQRNFDEQLNELKKQNNKLEKEVKLNHKRFEQQKDYNQRLEVQKDKYKTRMHVVEEKYNKLIAEVNSDS